MNYASIASRYAGRPLLLEPRAAHDLAMRLRAIDPRAFHRPGRLEAFMRRVGFSAAGGGREVLAWDDDGYVPPPPIEERLAYAPRWLGEVEDTGYCWSLSQNVALMQCDTPLVERGTDFCGEVYHGYDTLLLGMRDALGDERVKGLFVHMDSPGGVVADGLRVISEFMRENRELAGGKPIWVWANMACSAAYWITAGADRIAAPRVGYVGSIGAVIVHESYEKALEEYGLEVTSLEFPDGGEKTDGAWWKKLSDRARATLLSDVAQCGRDFIADVVASRPGFTEEALLATKAGVFMAAQDDPARSGMELGFVDAIAGEEELFAELVEHVTPSSPGTRITTSSTPTGSGAAATPQEATMGLSPQRQAALAAERRKLEARVAAIKAEEAGGSAPAAATDAGDEKDETGAATEAGGAAAATEDDPEDDAGDEKDETDASAGTSDAAAISASPEAKANPGLAFAAIQSGQTLAQFKANVAAMASAPRQSRLDAAMRDAQRLGGDGAKAEGGRSPFASAMKARADRNREAVSK